ncbi:hexokinase HKDC1-like [Pectinophora gossypiella]|uniref:hexokinase HKDC1-like n=1 Tax=Pectinophora gossypiella TaxID=13191 RepID=UPI00214ED3F5|nr:hexokinase HKDC1-like [Pectinophora gossypiella]
MSTAVETRLNGHAEPNGMNGMNGVGMNGVGVNGVNGDGSWEAQFLPPPLRIDDKVRAQKIERVLSCLVMCGNTLRRVGAVFERELEAGLQDQPSSLQMANTYVPELPDGTEEGLFLALDLGGTNFRVLVLELRGGQLVREDVRQYHINDALRLGPGEDLFNFLADCVLDFVRSDGMENEELSLGFTFSFPMKQHSILSGELVTWTKSFKCGGMGGVDVSALLQRCLDERGLKVIVRVLLNDTTGTLVAGAQQDPACGIGVILGTGSNGCYMERASRVTHWETSHDRVTDVCIDVEWGAFGDNGCLSFLRTAFDKEVDDNSLLTASFTFEKYIGGKYLGCVLRCALSGLAREGLFPCVFPRASLNTAHVSMFEQENIKGGWRETAAALSEAAGGAYQFTRDDALVAQHVAQLVSNRAAQLASVCIATLLRRMDRAHVAIAVDGSVYKKHPRISTLMQKYIALLAPEHSFSLLPADDGSGKGSALTAAIAARIKAREAAQAAS